MVAFEHPHPHGALAPTAHLELPFFDDAHRALANGLVAWTREQRVDESDDRAACKEWVQRLGAAGWLRYCVPEAHGGALPELDSRALVILRETLAYHSPLADFAFAMQGLGSGAITLAGTPAQQARYLSAVATGILHPHHQVMVTDQCTGELPAYARLIIHGCRAEQDVAYQLQLAGHGRPVLLSEVAVDRALDDQAHDYEHQSSQQREENTGSRGDGVR